MNETNQYSKGGMLMAEGLSNFGRGSEEQVKIDLISKSKVNDEAIAHGAIMALGLRYAFSNDLAIID